MNVKDTILNKYINSIKRNLENCELFDNKNKPLNFDKTFRNIVNLIKSDKQKSIFFIGNGGSNGISSHMATDWTKNGGMKSLSLDNSSTLTCIGNDFGYEHIYSKQIEFYAKKNDMLFVISSSGNSKNIINATDIARKMGLYIVTLSGFSKNNLLRQRGDINFYVPSNIYGYVEISHEIILHSILDFSMGLINENIKKS